MTGCGTYARRRAAGLCPSCGGERDDGHVYCSKCRLQGKEYRAWLIENHVCPKCRRNTIYGSERMCPECRAYEANLRAKKMKDPEKREYFNKQERESKRRRAEVARQTGMCTRCHVRKSDNPSGGMCKRCKAYRNEWQRKRRSEKSGKLERSMWVEMGLCYNCGSPNDNLPKHSCKKCASRNGHNFDGHRTTEHWHKQNALIFKKVGIPNERIFNRLD